MLKKKDSFIYSTINIDTLNKLKHYEYIIEYFDDIYANIGDNKYGILKFIQDYFRIILGKTDLENLTIDLRYMKKQKKYLKS